MIQGMGIQETHRPVGRAAKKEVAKVRPQGPGPEIQWLSTRNGIHEVPGIFKEEGYVWGPGWVDILGWTGRAVRLDREAEVARLWSLSFITEGFSKEE